MKGERKFNVLESEAILKEAEQLLEGGDAEGARCLASSVSRPSISSKDPAERRIGGQALLLEARCCEVLGKLAEAAHLYAGAGYLALPSLSTSRPKNSREKPGVVLLEVPGAILSRQGHYHVPLGRRARPTRGNSGRAPSDGRA